MKTLNVRGTTVPRLGLGTWQLKGADCTRAVQTALEIGYRHIDTAAAYDNETTVGAAIAESPVDRSDIFLTTKVWRSELAHDSVLAAVDASLVRLKTDYIDNMLLHWPHEDHPLERSLDALLECQAAGKLRHIGVSNYTPALYRRALTHTDEVWNNQVEHHVFLEQQALIGMATDNDGFLTAYSPLARGRLGDEPVLAAIAGETHSTPAQVALAWLLDEPGVVAVPKATSRGHLESNWGAQEVVLDAGQIARLNALDKDRRLIDPPFSPTWEARSSHL